MARDRTRRETEQWMHGVMMWFVQSAMERAVMWFSFVSAGAVLNHATAVSTVVS